MTYDPGGADPFSGPLLEPREVMTSVDFDGRNMSDVRAKATMIGRSFGLPAERLEDLSLAVGELVGNSVRHGGGTGRLRAWEEAGVVVIEVSDAGRIDSLMAGRVRPAPDRERGIGLWLVHQLSDLVQVRSGSDGTTVRAHFRSAAR